MAEEIATTSKLQHPVPAPRKSAKSEAVKDKTILI
jgi:hypothetical protein